MRTIKASKIKKKKRNYLNKGDLVAISETIRHFLRRTLLSINSIC